MTTPFRPDLEVDPPFLDDSPPHWAARGLSTLMIALFVVLLLAAVLVTVPETVTGAFVLVPERGADPVRTPREGTVAEVLVSEGDNVKQGTTLFIIRSQSVGDRMADMRGVEMQGTGVQARLTNASAEYESQRRADALESARLTTRAASLERIATLKRKQLVVTRDMADRSKRGQQSGAVGGWEADRLGLEADQLAADVETVSAERDEARASLAKLKQDASTREVQHRELLRSLQQEGEIARVRVESMKRLPAGAQGDLVVTAPCSGSLLRMMVSTAGAVVQAGDPLGEIACAGERLQVEMTLGQQDVSRVRVGQGAKLLYDAFPYQRFGARAGRVRWVGPASAGRATSTPTAEGVFRALIDAGDSTIAVRGEPRPLLVGMRGEARVVTGRRSLISYAFEPIRALRENISGAPSAAPTPAAVPKASGTTPLPVTRPAS
ncbi:MAG: HlyD family efflux transporter periplasmic adaptor subunit [bacterium]